MFLYKEVVLVPPISMIDDLITFSKCGVNSIVTNAIINTKIEMKKLEFGPSKCHVMHIGKKETCYPLKAHNTILSKTDFAVYLGDTLMSTGANCKTIESRRNLGIGAISQIFSLVDEESLGHYYFEILNVLRDSILMSKLIFSSEIWYNVTKENIKKIEEIDEIFWRKTFEVSRNVAKESLYITSGKMPLKYSIMKRRLL